LIGPWLLGAGLLACAPGDRATGVLVRDSADIQIVENQTPAWSDNASWRLASSPEVDIGSDRDSSPELFRVEDVIGLGDNYAVINAASSEVLLFDSDGRLVRRIGGRGEGPGEFSRLRSLYRCGGDTLVVNDVARVSYFDVQGNFVRTAPIAPPNADEFPRILGVASDCSTFVMSGNFTPGPARGVTARRSSYVFRAGLDRTPRDTIGSFPGQELVGTTVDGIDQFLYLPWGVDGVWAIDADRYYFASSDQPEIRVYARRSGLTQIVRWPAERAPVSAEDRRLYEQKRLWLLERFPGIAQVVPPLASVGALPADKPLFRSIIVDDEHNLWVRRYPDFIAGRPDLYDRDVPLRYSPPPGDVPEVYSVIDAAGRWLGEVDVPADFVVRGVYRNRVLGVWKDELDVEHVRVYRLLKEAL
jgi:hypothetical protein